MPWAGLQYVIVVFLDHAHLLFNPINKMERLYIWQNLFPFFNITSNTLIWNYLLMCNTQYNMYA